MAPDNNSLPLPPALSSLSSHPLIIMSLPPSKNSVPLTFIHQHHHPTTSLKPSTNLLTYPHLLDPSNHFHLSTHPIFLSPSPSPKHHNSSSFESVLHPFIFSPFYILSLLFHPYCLLHFTLSHPIPSLPTLFYPNPFTSYLY
jgi:hypothetical protein